MPDICKDHAFFIISNILLSSVMSSIKFAPSKLLLFLPTQYLVTCYFISLWIAVNSFIISVIILSSSILFLNCSFRLLSLFIFTLIWLNSQEAHLFFSAFLLLSAYYTVVTMLFYCADVWMSWLAPQTALRLSGTFLHTYWHIFALCYTCVSWKWFYFNCEIVSYPHLVPSNQMLVVSLMAHLLLAPHVVRPSTLLSLLICW